MSVRDGLLAILSLGPAYGLQLHSELTARAPHRGPVNVGQIYATLDRLSKQGLVEPAGLTADGLPQYTLTEAGATRVGSWKASPVVDTLPEWTEMLDQVLIASSIDPGASVRLAGAFATWWSADLARVRDALADRDLATDARLALLARETQGVAALSWLASAKRAIAGLDAARPYSTDKPKRGRRRAAPVGA